MSDPRGSTVNRPDRPVLDPILGALLLCALGVADLIAILWASLAFAMASDPCAWGDCASTGWPRVGIAVATGSAGLGVLIALVGYGRALDEGRTTIGWPFVGFAFTVVGWKVGAWLAAPVW
ncbi:hypothetical protein FK268_01790 [Tsukamurella sputi]|uniref:Uncharacterized protein n=1 Tax=Tsukamurella sputi TaxID=2591848 RepID=A0A5C5RTU7_9ACTN|nr:hypothetical protein [Tsukamurella sputi]TWS26008.1 hypothetical protein FK268_01790 [Tsukamurella sputi]